MADKFTRSSAGVLASLGSRLNPDGINTGNPLSQTTCPISHALLYDLYWKQGKSMKEIAEYCRTISDTNTSAESVRVWMNKSGIEVRSLSQAHKIAFKKEPEKRKICARNLSRNRRAGQSPEVLLKMQKKGRRAAIQAKKSRLITRECSNPGCTKVICRRPCEMKKEFNYCSFRCAAFHFHERRRHEKLRKKAEQVFGKTLS